MDRKVEIGKFSRLGLKQGNYQLDSEHHEILGKYNCESRIKKVVLDNENSLSRACDGLAETNQHYYANDTGALVNENM